ncbi:MAG TPA: hypothetical protein VE422_48955 [Terriglobia bacterium]|nr:hypothetical protein [Terriglobia bacterium]
MKWIVGFSIIAAIVGVIATTTIPAATITPDQAILKFFPQETEGVAFIDVAGLRNSPLAKDYLDGKFARLPRGAQEFEEATGFSVQRDLDRVTVGRLGEREILAVVEGTFDPVKFEQFAGEKGAQSETYRGRAIYRHDHGAVAFVDNVVLAGSYDAVKKSIDQVSLPGSPTLRSDLLDSIKTIDAGNQVWAVGDFYPEQLPPQVARTPAANLIREFKGGTYQMRVDQDIHARAIGNFSSAEHARSAADLARGAIALAKLQASRMPDQTFVQALDGIQIANSGASLTVNIDASGEVLKKLPDYHRPTIERAQ